MPNPTWFNEAYYATQKVEQMNATGYEQSWLAAQNATTWTVDLYNQYLAQYTLDGNPVSAYDNFVVCNGKDYASGIGLGDINVSPNQYFNVNEYLQALANYNNAHPDAWTEGTAPAGGWNMANQLEAIFDQYQASVWEHYNASWDTLLINPSNAFDTGAYLEARAAAMGEGTTVQEAIQAIKDLGLNPVQDFFGFGAEHNISATPAVDQVTPELPDADWTVWGNAVTPPEPVEPPDPFEEDVTNVAITSDQTVYPGEGETYSGSTRFEASYLPSSGQTTLNAKDVITGPEGDTYNTLAVTLGKNWNGFNGKLADSTAGDNVQHIGRVELIHNPANNEASYTFDAKGISDDTYRFDLVGANGPGSINLKGLSGAVNEIHISDLLPKDVSKNNSKAPEATQINFEDNANNGKHDALKLVVENVGADAGRAEVITSKNWGIEDLTVEATKSTDSETSYLDLSKLTGTKTLTITGGEDIQITDVASGITKYDASAAKGNVTLAVRDPRSSTTVIGGEGSNDVVNLVSGATWTPASLDNVEALQLHGSTVNLVNVEAGLKELWVDKAGGTLKNLSADDFTVHLANTTTGEVNVNGTKEGSLQNVTFSTSDSKADQTADTVSTNASGAVTVKVGESATGFDVTKFNADNAIDLTVNAACNVVVNGGSLKALQNLTLNLENSQSGNTVDSSSIEIALPNAQNVTVNADGQSVTLGNLGSAKGDSSITLDVNDATGFTVGDITATLGCNISVDIEASGEVELGETISNTTDLLAGGQGDINIVVSGDHVIGGYHGLTINGGPMSIDLTDVTGSAFAEHQVDTDPSGKPIMSAGVALFSQGTISYQGAGGRDVVAARAVGDDTVNEINLGDGDDLFAVGKPSGSPDPIELTSNDSVATFNVALGSGNDTLAVGQVSKGYVVVNVSDFESGEHVYCDINPVTGTTNTDIDKVNDILEDCGIDFEIDATTRVVSSATWGASPTPGGMTGYTDGTNIYMINGNVGAASVIVIEDCTDLG